MTFEVKPEILTVDKIDGLNTEFNALSANTANLLAQTNNLGGSLPESSKQLQVLINGEPLYFTVNQGQVYYANNLSSQWKQLVIDEDTVTQGHSYYAIEWYENKFIAISAEGRMYYSYDGINWIKNGGFISQNAYNSAFKSIASVNGRVVVANMADDFVGETIMSSFDGIHWTTFDKNLFHGTQAFVFKGDIYTYCYSHGQLCLISPKWLNPYPLNWPSIQYMMDFASNNDFLIGIDFLGNIYKTYDAYTWSIISISNKSQRVAVVDQIIYFKNKFVALISSWNNPSINVSTDGENWLQNKINLNTNGWSVAKLVSGNEKLVTVDSEGRIYYSTDAINWTQGIIPWGSYQGTTRYISFLNNQFIVGSYWGSMAVSNDLSTWTVRTYGVGLDTYNRLTYFKGNVNKTFSEILGVN